jgi:nucleoside-diphosphate-sugar epimerase
MSGERPVIFGDGEQSRDFTYVANVVEANLLAMDADAAVSGEVFNVACGERVTLNRLVAELRELLESDVEAVYAAPRAGDIRHSLADLSHARARLGYEPTVQLREGLEKTIAHFRSADLIEAP